LTGHDTKTGASRDCSEFLNCLDDCFYIQHVRDNTREDAILDLVLSTDQEAIADLRVVENLDSSDHNMITWAYRFRAASKTEEQTRRRDYAKRNYDAIKREVLATNWEGLFTGDADQWWVAFRDRMLQLEENYIPLRKLRSKRKKNCIWMTGRAVDAVNRKRNIYSKYGDVKHPAVINANRRAKKEVRKEQNGTLRKS